ncbi:MAG: GTPase Era [Pseudomonadota bacterium]
MDQQSENFRFGFVAIAGRPNVGTSTLLNRIVGRELSIVTPKAQTTRTRVSGINTTQDAQMVLLDTPGIHEAKTTLNKAMVDAAVKTLNEVDVVVLMTTPSNKVLEEDRRIVELISAVGVPAVLAVNKIDTVRATDLLPIIDAYSKVHDFTDIVPISALNGSGVPDLVGVLLRILPFGPLMYPEDDESDMPIRFFVAEIIREQVTLLTGEEIPYKTAVMVESFQEKLELVVIHADIHVERSGQKKIIIGKGGSMIKRIGTAAREKIEDLIQNKVHLELFVKVTPRWTTHKGRLREFGYLTK